MMWAIVLLLGQSWTTDDDYPAIALRQHWAGSVETRLTVSPKGAVTECIVAESSGHKELDDAACSLITKRLHFKPARDSDGKRIASERSFTFNWTLPR